MVPDGNPKKVGAYADAVEVRCCRRLKFDAVGGPMLSNRRCRRPQRVHLSASIGGGTSCLRSGDQGSPNSEVETQRTQDRVLHFIRES